MWGRDFEPAVEEVGGEGIGGQPTAMQEESVNFVGKDVFLVVDALCPERSGEANRAGERHVAVVIALDEQDR